MNSKKHIEGYVGELDGGRGRKKCNCIVISKKKGRIHSFKSPQEELSRYLSDHEREPSFNTSVGRGDWFSTWSLLLSTEVIKPPWFLILVEDENPEVAEVSGWHH